MIFATMGKKLLPTMLLLLSMLIALAHAVVPHHEHGEVLCLEARHCFSDSGHLSEEQNSDLGTPPHTHHPQSCCNNSTTVVNLRKQIQQGVVKANPSNQFGITLWGYVCSAYLLDFFEQRKISHFSTYSNLYTSIFAHINHGLRAPPFFS